MLDDVLIRELGGGLRALFLGDLLCLLYTSREAQMMKIPYMLVLGDKEAAEGTVAVRVRGQGDVGTMTADELIGRMKEEVRTRAIF